MAISARRQTKLRIAPYQPDGGKGRILDIGREPVLTLVAIVKELVAAAPLGVTEAGLNVQVEKVGNPEQLNVVAEL